MFCGARRLRASLQARRMSAHFFRLNSPIFPFSSTTTDPIVAFLSVFEGSDQDLLGDTFEQVPASTDDLSIR